MGASIPSLIAGGLITGQENFPATMPPNYQQGGGLRSGNPPQMPGILQQFSPPPSTSMLQQYSPPPSTSPYEGSQTPLPGYQGILQAIAGGGGMATGGSTTPMPPQQQPPQQMPPQMEPPQMLGPPQFAPHDVGDGGGHRIQGGGGAYAPYTDVAPPRFFSPGNPFFQNGQGGAPFRGHPMAHPGRFRENHPGAFRSNFVRPYMSAPGVGNIG